MNTLKQVIANKEIRNKLLFTLLCVAIFRIGATIPLPVLKIDAMKELVETNAFFNMYELFSGGTFSQLSLFTLGITPYITASIVINLLTLAFPRLEEITQEGEAGRRKIKRYTVILGITIAAIQATGFTQIYFKPFLINDSLALKLLTIGVLTLGVYFLTLIDKQIEKKGIGKGASIIICSSILSRLPQSVFTIISSLKSNTLDVKILLVITIGLILLILLVIQVQEATRKVIIHYAKHSAVAEVQSQKSYLPLKLNQSGITPVIFAQTILTFPQMLGMFLSTDASAKINSILSVEKPLFNILLALLIIFFNYFYTTLAFDTDKLADNLKKANGFIEGVRPGKETAMYLNTIMQRLMSLGNVFLIFIALTPLLVRSVSPVSTALAGTSLLIITGTSIDIIKQIKAQVTSGKKRIFFNA